MCSRKSSRIRSIFHTGDSSVPKGTKIPSVVQKLWPFYWWCGFGLLVELHREGSASAACAAGLFLKGPLSDQGLIKRTYMAALHVQFWVLSQFDFWVLMQVNFFLACLKKNCFFFWSLLLLSLLLLSLLSQFEFLNFVTFKIFVLGLTFSFEFWVLVNLRTKDLFVTFKLFLDSINFSKQACCAGCRRRPFPMQLHQ